MIERDEYIAPESPLSKNMNHQRLVLSLSLSLYTHNAKQATPYKRQLNDVVSLDVYYPEATHTPNL